MYGLKQSSEKEEAGNMINNNWKVLLISKLILELGFQKTKAYESLA